MSNPWNLINFFKTWQHQGLNNQSRRMDFLHLPVDDLEDPRMNQSKNQLTELTIDASIPLSEVNTNRMANRIEGEVCLMKESPYRILRVAESGNLNEFEKLLLAEPSRLFTKDPKGRCVAHVAASKNRVNILQFSLEHGIDINTRDVAGNTAMHAAVEHEAIEALEFLLINGADGQILNEKKQAPLHLATELNKVAVVRVLMKYKDKIDLLQGGEHGRTALHIAAIHDFDECAEIMVSQTHCSAKRTCNNGYYPIHEAAKNASAKTLEVILRWGESMGCDRRSMMKLHDAEGNDPLHSAVNGGDIQAVKLCLENGAIISSQQHNLSTPLHLACSQGAIDIIKLMFMLQPEEKHHCLRICDVQRMTPLHCAAMFDHVDIVEYLVKEEARIDAVDKEKRSPLLLAASRGAWRTVEALLRLGASPIMRDSSSRNVMHFIVVQGGQLDHFAFLMQQVLGIGIEDRLNEKDIKGCTPMHYASRDGHFRSIDSLIKFGARINMKDNDHQSPLHFAARYGRYNTVRQLLQSDKGPFIINETDGAGLTALHIASMNGHTRVVQLLLSKGALLHKALKSVTPTCRGLLVSITEELWMRIEAAWNDISQTDIQNLFRRFHAVYSQLALFVVDLQNIDFRVFLITYRDHNGQTPLHLAAKNGYTQTMELLLTVHSHLLDQTDKDGNTALHLAVMANKAGTISYLIDMNCKFLVNTSGETPLDIAVQSKHHEAAMALCTHDRRAQDILNMPSNIYSCMSQALISFMPDVYMAVLDNNITKSDCKKDSKEYYIKYSFVNLQYSKELIRKRIEKNKNYRPCPLPAINRMVQNGRVDLLTHPITQQYLHMKWHAYGMYFHLANLFVYMIFLSFVTAFAARLINVHKPFYKRRLGNQDEKFNAEFFCYINAAVITGFVGINILKEGFQLYQQRMKYILDPINLLEWILYISAAIMVSPVYRGLFGEAQLIATAIAVFLAWFNFLLYLQRFDRIGIYVVMFLEILKTLIKVLLVFSILIIAFGLAFYILLSQGNHIAFYDLPLSLMRVFTMMLGEIDFLGTYVGPLFKGSNITEVSSGKRDSDDNMTLPYPGFSFVFLAIFMIFMPILLMNLLIGLAVGDIESVRRNAQLKRIAMQVELHTELERKLPRFLLDKVDKDEIIEYPNNPCNKCPKIWNFIMKYIDSKKPKTMSDRLMDRVQDDDYLYEEIFKQKNRLKEMNRSLEQQHQLLRLIVQKMEIKTEADDFDEGCNSKAVLKCSTANGSRWRSPKLNRKLKSSLIFAQYMRKTIDDES